MCARGQGRRLVSAVVLTLVASTVPAIEWPHPAVAQAPPAQPACPEGRPDRAAALLSARWCKGRVEVTGELSESLQVWANPDGTLTAEQHSGPVRMRDAQGRWTAVDLNLVANADGTVSAKAHPRGLWLSGPAGTGDHDVVTLGSGQDAIGMVWSGPLPKPVLDGPTATYPEVTPGVDLVIRATRTGYEQLFVVKNRAALATAGSLPLRLRTPNRTVSPDGAGGMQFKDKAGRDAGRIPQPSMWDARIGTQSGDHVRVAPVGLTRKSPASGQAADVALQLSPDRTFVADPSIQFPVTIDPSIAPTFDTYVQSGTTSDQSGSTELKLGFSDDGGSFTARSFLQWNTGFLSGTHVNDARVYLWEFHSWSCTAASWEVWSTGATSTATRWTNQPGWNTKYGTSSETKGYSASCNDGWVSAPATGFFQFGADTHNGGMTMGLRATDEGTHNSWKKFDSTEAAHDPYAVVTFNGTPQVTSRSTTPSTTCVIGSARPFVNTTQPKLQAQLTDPEGSPVSATFEWWVTGGSMIGSSTVGPQASGSTFTATVPAGAFSNGGTYSWRVRGSDGSLTGAYSSWCEFTLDTAEPTAAPGVSSSTVPDNTWTGAPPTYTVTTAAQTYVDGTTTVPLTGDDAVAAVALPFTVNFFNEPYNGIWVDTDGMLFFTDPGGPVLTPCCANLPNVGSPDAVLYAFTEDLLVDASASVRTAVVGSAPNRQFVVDWHNVARFDNQSERLNVEVVLGENGTISYDYSSLDNNDEKGANALVGLEDQTGSQGVPYSQYQPILANNTAVIFHPAQLSVSGYTAATATRAYTPATTVTTLSADDATLLQAAPFPIKYYGNTYNQLWIDTNGQIDFVNPNGSNSEHLVPLPDPAQPNGTVNVFGDDLDIDASANVRTSLTGTAPNRQYTIEWNNATFFNFPGKRISAEVIFNETSGDITLDYTGIDPDSVEQGGNALVGIENPSGLIATQYAYHQSILATNTAITFHPTPSTPLVDAGTSVPFTFTPGGIADVASYQYGLDTNPPATVVNAASLGGNATATITPDTGGVHKLYVRSQDRAGNQSPITTYTLNIGAGGLTSPDAGDTSAGKTALTVAAGPAASGVTYQWRRADTDTWATIPAGDVTVAAGGGAVSWPLAPSGGAFPKLNWNLDTTLNNAEAGPDPLDGPLQVRAVFTGAIGGASVPVKITYDRNQNSAAAVNLGAGSLNLLTGNYTVSAADVSASSYDSDLSVTRAFNTRRAGATDKANMFGPGWVSNVAVEGADAPYTDLTVTGSLVEIGQSDGDPLGFTETTATAAGKTYEAENGYRQLRLTYTASTDSYTLMDIQGNTVTFTHVAGAPAGTYNPTAVNTPGVNQSTSISWQKVTVAGTDVVRATRMLAPVPTGVTCATLVKGCRALDFTYATATTATGTTATQWGDYLGRVTQISFTAWDPDTSPAAMRTVVIARYSYDNAGRLRAEWDPRLDWTDTSTTPPTTRHLSGTYDYDADGILTTITPAGGQEPWQLSYTTVPGDPGKGRLAQVSRSALSAGTARTTVVYRVPTSGAGAPYDLSATQTTRWGEAEQPVDATAVFDAGQVPTGNQATGTMPSSYERATTNYMDANGRAVNTVAPGGYTTTTWFDSSGNTVRQLTAGNRERALNASSTDTAAAEAAIAASLSTTSVYSLDGRRLLETWEPERDAVLPDGTVVRGRIRTTDAYDEGAPSTGAPFDLVTTETSALCYGTGSCVPADAHTTTTAYDWTLRDVTASTEDPGGLALTTRTSYDATTGAVTATTAPAGGTSTNTPATRITVYYRAGTGSGYAECDSHPEWAGLTCRTQPGGQAASGPELPVTVTTYNIYDQPRVNTEKTSAGVLRTSTTTYDTAGRASTGSVTGTSGTGTAVATTRTVYDPASGQAVRMESLDTANNVTAQIVRTYDTLGRITSYTDADGNGSTTTYDLLSRVATTSDGQATRTYSYDGGSERRSLPTQVNDSQAGVITGAYNADGDLVSEAWPNGVTVTTRFDEGGGRNFVSYDQPGCGQPNCTLFTETVQISPHDQVRNRASTLSSQQYTYDQAGRLTTVNDTVFGSCTTRVNVYNTASDRTNVTTYAPTTSGACQTTTAASSGTWTYDSASRVNTTGYTYDALGRTTAMPAADTLNPSGANSTMTYHVNDMVRTQAQDARTITYTLDVVQNRFRSWVDSDGSSTLTRVSHFVDDTDNPAWIIANGADVSRPVRGLGGVSAMYSSVGGTVWQIANLQGDLVAGVAATGGLAYAGDYTELGQPHNAADTGQRPYGWHGADQRWSDTPGGTIVMGARQYAPGTGRFLSVDPVYAGSANAYDYCAGDGVNCTDIQGTRFCSRFWKTSHTTTSWRTGFRTTTVNAYCSLNNNQTWFSIIILTVMGMTISGVLASIIAGAVCGEFGPAAAIVCGGLVWGAAAFLSAALGTMAAVYPWRCPKQKGVTLHMKVIFKYHWITTKWLSLVAAIPYWPSCNS